jgi:glycosyltransferase involved in cell wall biosynthesis
MKIAMLTTWFPPLIIGSGNRFYEVGKRLSKRHEIHVYTTGIEGCVNEEEMDGMYIHRCGIFDTSKSIEKESYLLNLKFSLYLLRKKNPELRFDIIDCNIVSKTLPYVSYFISKSIRVPLIETWHEVWYKQNFTQYNPVMALPGFFMELFMPKLADINVVVSETTKRRLVSLLGADPNKIFMIHNGVDLMRFRDILAEKQYGRILYVGRLESHKRVDALIHAYKRLKRFYSDIELIIVGTGPQKGNLKNLSKRLNLDVRFYEPMQYEKLIAMMKSSWVLVLPSIREGQGIVLLEAMAAGTPPVAVKIPGSGVVDVIKDGYNGLLTAQGELESAIEKLLTMDDLYYRLRENGLEFVKKYDWDIIAKKTEDVYEHGRAICSKSFT